MFHQKQENQACLHVVDEVLCWGPAVPFLIHLHVVSSLATDILSIVTRDCNIKRKAGFFQLICAWRSEYLLVHILSGVL